jgi:GTPase SAR1 family protein
MGKGVGKTSLVHLLCHKEPLLRPEWTVGCSTDVLVSHSLFYFIFLFLDAVMFGMLGCDWLLWATAFHGRDEGVLVCAHLVGKIFPREGKPPVALEFWDVGGSARYETSRSVFYRDAHGTVNLIEQAHNERLNPCSTKHLPAPENTLPISFPLFHFLADSQRSSLYSTSATK